MYPLAFPGSLGRNSNTWLTPHIQTTSSRPGKCLCMTPIQSRICNYTVKYWIGLLLVLKQRYNLWLEHTFHSLTPTPQFLLINLRCRREMQKCSSVGMDLPQNKIATILCQNFHGVVKLSACQACLNTAELQWFEHIWDHENMFETGVVQANQC